MCQVVIVFACVCIFVFVYSLSFEFIFQVYSHQFQALLLYKSTRLNGVFKFAPQMEGISFWLFGDSGIDDDDDDEDDDDGDDDDSDNDALQWCPIMIMI